MGEKTIYITEYDIGRLEKLFSRTEVPRRDQDSLDILEEEIGKCKVVKSDEVPPDVVTINSRVRLRDLGADKEMTVRLVLPHMADLSEGRLSVVSPIGTAILGYAVGDIIEWEVRSGTKKISVEEILYQPEAAGDFHL
ncbi:MAG: nucleoside diphosphate kinase regulator [Desulfuromonadales bacterium]|nr:nucleoside diphosphate kinase regulator [Desulfuromonadales bacterium]